MSFDPNKEDYQRLGLRFAASLDGQDPQNVARSFASFGRTFARDRDSLPQTDQDRAFHLVAVAATTIDYELPFADDVRAKQLIRKGHQLLDEALQLDPTNVDAQRMKAAADIPSFEGYYDFLLDGVDSAREKSFKAAGQAAEAEPHGERARLARELALRPYLRWLSTLASKAIICGHNRQALATCQKVFELDTQDQADARFTAAIAYAKLEDEQGLEGLRRFGRKQTGLRSHDGDDAWLQIARISIAYKRHDLSTAESRLRALLGSYPFAAEAIVSQRELPDGVFARLAVPAFSEDELILAISECTVLIQEGRDRAGRGALGSWLIQAAHRIDPAGASRGLEQDSTDGPKGGLSR